MSLRIEENIWENGISFSNDQPKVYHIIRKDLGMTSAKMAVQCCHGMDLIHVNEVDKISCYKQWVTGTRKTIVCEIKTLARLENLIELLEANGIQYFKIYDYGLTEFGETTFTGISLPPLEEMYTIKKIKNLQLWKDNK